MSENGYATHYAFRDELAERVEEDLFGPTGTGHEVLGDPPVTTYPIGVLFPQELTIVPEEEPDPEDDLDASLTADLVKGDEAGAERGDGGVSLANRRRPSAAGLTFAVDRVAAPKVNFTVAAARYIPVDAEGNSVSARRTETRTTLDDGTRWKRIHHEATPDPVDITVPGSRTLSDFDGLKGLELRVIVRQADANGWVAVTATLVNTQPADPDCPQDELCFFQPRLVVNAPAGSGGLVERRQQGRHHDEELDVMRLLYRHAPTFATGHGCAAHWDWNPPAANHMPANGEPSRIDSVRIAFVPTYEVLLTDSPAIDSPALGMKRLSEAAPEQIVAILRELLTSYEQWIEERERDVDALRATEFDAMAGRQIELCRTALARMHSGIDRIANDPHCMEAFKLANEAMSEQRARTVWIKKGSEGEPRRDEGKWRPFQIGFMLLCFDGVADPGHPDREIADLLWFPTGGGKTEAYLGLIAFTVFLRRLRRGESGGGVTVLMRYTLRLLTLQQFERAATLICAMEGIRLRHGTRLGTEKITIGMWVGHSATPNDLKTAASNLRKLRKDEPVATENPVQLRACPWCGTPLDASHYSVTAQPAAMLVACPNVNCDFQSGLPVHVVDETVYKARPTLIIATVDKFAMVPWRQEAAALFNRNRPTDDTPPPELIVQDELHLISGPLGTLTGLYETMVDLAANTPKVIASTATIRRAKKQGNALFRREVQQFPPTGLDARDSWFAVESPRESKATRRYMGLLAPATSQATLLVRAYAALLHHAAHTEGDEKARDAYWTLVGYFNSLRILAAADLQVRDDVEDRLKHLAEGAGVKRRELNDPTELTSRVDASAIPTYLKDLERNTPHPDAVDVLLATNMISVGVDVDRLGLMAVMGQPQTTAEYIQATSRVGRQHPGLVVTLLNSARSRDRSHYENFTAYHSALYRQVESTSVTPFSPRARDRALHAVLIGLARVTLEEARPKTAAAKVGRFVDKLDDIIRNITDRARAIDPSDAGQTEADQVQNELELIVERWLAYAEEHPDDLVYEGWFKKRPALLVPFAEADGEEPPFPTLTSMRDVDAESDLFQEK
ncbi:helicase-related protein [Streptomyces sp. NPDC023998]|uniref:helicase-related protein n=1 Tax=Streptomyces sp. NPDC023998 TaxID=3154597 RepID=UPI00340BC388